VEVFRLKDQLLSVIQKPTTIEELKSILAITDASNFKLLVKTLNELEDKGHLIIKDDYYDLATNHGIYVGELSINKKGFGFVDTESLDSDIFVPKHEISNAMHRDIVIVQSTRPKGEGFKQEGRVLRVLSSSIKFLIGTYYDYKDRGYVTPDDAIFAKKIKIRKEDSLGAVENHKVRVEILDYFE